MSVASPARPYRVDVPPSTIADLKHRLRHTRWPDEPTRDWRYGASPAFIRELVAYWIESFDWSYQQARINTLPHFQASIRGRAVHFIHVRGTGQHPLPIVLTHGWPSTFLEMSRLIPLLTSPAEHGADPADSFDVIVPSLPDFGFSQPLPIGAALGEICATWHELLTTVLGYRSYGAHGGDIGASVTARLAALYPESLTAIHLTSVSGSAILRYLGRRCPSRLWRRARVSGCPGTVVRRRRRLRTSTANQATNAGLRPERFPGRAVCMDRRETARME